MDKIVDAIILQRNTMAARCLDLELEVHARDHKIAELEAHVKKLMGAEDGLRDN